MPWTYAWTLPIAEKPREVRLQLGALGREVLKVDGVAVLDAYSFKIARRIPVPLGAGHTAGVEVSMARLWPKVTLSVDGQTIAPSERPRVPLWGWASAFACSGVFFAPMHPPDIAKGALRGALAGVAMGLCVYVSAALRPFAGLIACALSAAAAWATLVIFK